MIGKMFSLGINVATLPARLALSSGMALLTAPANLSLLMVELRQAGNQARRDVQLMLQDVDNEMRANTGHLDAQQKQQAASLALDAAEQHLGMAVTDMLRALWLVGDSKSQRLKRDREPVTIDQVD